MKFLLIYLVAAATTFGAAAASPYGVCAHLNRMQNPGQAYRAQTTYSTGGGGIMRWCWSMILLNLLCNCCCGNRWFFYRPF